MPVALEQFVKSLTESGVISAGKLENFLPPKASPKDAQELARELIKSQHLTKYQAQEIYHGRARGLILGNYTLVDKIGAGGMGQVFKAQHRRMDRIVAIKMLPASLTKDELALARFDREVKAAARLSHPNIVAAHDADEANGVHFLVMEYVEGSDLSALVKKEGPLPVAKAVNCLLQAARGLEFAHGEGVIHRDIKPANLLLDKKGVVKILDMGLARIEAGGLGATQAELTGTGAVMGTVDYMAPEQAMSTKHADARSDIYSLGVTLWYLLTGQPMYEGETIVEKLMGHQTKPIPILSELHPEVPDALQAVFCKMVAKSVGDRYQSMTEVIADLAACQSGTQASPGNTQFNLSSSENDLSAFDFGVSKKSSLAHEMPTQLMPTKATKKSARQPASSNAGGKGKRKTWVLASSGGTVLGLAIVAAAIMYFPDDQPNKKLAKPTTEKTATATFSALPAGPVVSNTALEFDGQSSLVHVPWKYDGSHPLTLEVWATFVREPDYNSSEILIGDFADAGTGIGSSQGHPTLERRSGKWAYWTDTGGFVSTEETQSFVRGRPVHVAGVYDGAGEIRFYIDGQLQSRASCPSPYKKSPQSFVIGGNADHEGKGYFCFKGQVHSVRITRRARYIDNFDPQQTLSSDADTAVLYQIDEGQGDVLHDASGNKHNGTIVGAKWVTRTPPSTTKIAKNFALEFDGDGDYVEIPTLPYEPPTEYTLEARFQRQSAARGSLVWVASPNYASLWTADQDSVGMSLALYQGGERGASLMRTGLPAGAPEEVHVAGVFDGKTITIFVDGQLIVRDAVVPKSNLPHTRIGGMLGADTSTSNSISGKLDEVRISNVARYREPFSPPKQNDRFAVDKHTLALYHFDEGQGDELKDSSGHNHHGKIVGAKWVSSAPSTAEAIAVRPGLEFDGVDDYVEIPSLSYDDPAKPICFEAWVVPRRASATAHVITINGPSALSLHQFAGGWASNRMLNGIQEFVRQELAAIVPDVRVHLAASWDGNRQRCFVNGKMAEHSRQTSVDLFPAQGSHLAVGQPIGSPIKTFFAGRIDNVRVSSAIRYDKDFTPAQLLEDDKDTLALYNFDEGQGESLRDSSGHNHHGKIVGAKWVSSDAEREVAVLSGLEFDGIDDYAEIATLTTDAQLGSPLTLEVQVTPLAAPHGVVQIARIFAPRSLSLVLNGHQIWSFDRIDESGKTTQCFQQLDPDFIGRPVQLCGIWDGEKIRLFVDGKETDALGQDNLAATKSTRTLIGASSIDDESERFWAFFKGRYHQLRLSRGALYDDDYTPPAQFASDDNTLALYKFDEGQGEVLNDSSGHNHRGKIVGAQWVRGDQPPTTSE